MLVIAVVGYFFGENAAQGQIMTHISGQIGPNGTQTIQALLAASRDATSGIVASIIATLYIVADRLINDQSLKEQQLLFDLADEQSKQE